MWATLRSRYFTHPSCVAAIGQPWNLAMASLSRKFCTSTAESFRGGMLDLQEIEKVLNDVHADDVKVIPVNKRCDWADYMVLATGRSTWHVKNIANALIYKAKQKQKGVEMPNGTQRSMLPSVQGQEEGKWVVVDSGRVIVHALDENARAYYNLENLWTSETPPQKESSKDLEKAFVKIRPKNNSKKKPPATKTEKMVRASNAIW